MKALAQELRKGIDNICGRYHYEKIDNVVEEAKKLAEKIQEFCTGFLQGNIYGIAEEEYQNLANYVFGVMRDYLDAMTYLDDIFMLDTLDFGLRELINIYIDEDTEERDHE